MKNASKFMIGTGAALLLGSPCVAGPIEDVNKAEDYRYTVEIAKNRPEIEKILGAEFFYNQPDGTYKTRSAYIESTLKDSMTQAERYNVKTEVIGNTAIVQGNAKVLVDLEGKLTPFDLRYLNVWVYRDGRWQLVARQSAPKSD
ncbi:nuclear transport factor 2 family protein [Synechococcus sp. A10-1-5-9]|uniref:nuclear transport factor 2 family protein n=1 Tax=Synechococcus sp. A10-1-5-9 TaxID=3392295 RepID=UPI0039EA95DE